MLRWLAIPLMPLTIAFGDTLTFNNPPPQSKHLSDYREAGMVITTKSCQESPPDTVTRHHNSFERHCRIFFARPSESSALKFSEFGTSYYLFSMGGRRFDLNGFDILDLEGTGELEAPSGEVLRFNSFASENARFRVTIR